ncbi:hypothetical protein B0H19DRAFT_1077728 [Mycena capillaripes]|nr:hypothetical protein B0H19DRAFT_1077728 [Mycena capillaripes]
MRLDFEERVALMRASPLVNFTWANIFDNISSRDVYIPSRAFCCRFIRRLRGLPPDYQFPYIAGFLERLRGRSNPSTYSTHPSMVRRQFRLESANLACRNLKSHTSTWTTPLAVTTRLQLGSSSRCGGLKERPPADGLRRREELSSGGAGDVSQHPGIGGRWLRDTAERTSGQYFTSAGVNVEIRSNTPFDRHSGSINAGAFADPAARALNFGSDSEFVPHPSVEVQFKFAQDQPPLRSGCTNGSKLRKL